MTESKWSIPTPDGKIIYGVINKTTSGKNRNAVLHIHGLTGDPYEFASNVMAQQFIDQGYDVIRPHLYYGHPEARNLVDCTIAIHGQDIDTTVSHFATQYDGLFATGHSYGGPSIMSSDTDMFKAISLWDPTYDPSVAFDKNNDMPKIDDYYVLVSGTWRLMGQAMYDESLTFTKEHSRNLARNCVTPLQVILASDGRWIKEGESFHNFATGPTDSLVIPGSVHCFYEEGTTEPLLKATKDWFDRFAD